MFKCCNSTCCMSSELSSESPHAASCYLLVVVVRKVRHGVQYCCDIRVHLGSLTRARPPREDTREVSLLCICCVWFLFFEHDWFVMNKKNFLVYLCWEATFSKESFLLSARDMLDMLWCVAQWFVIFVVFGCGNKVTSRHQSLLMRYSSFDDCCCG